MNSATVIYYHLLYFAVVQVLKCSCSGNTSVICNYKIVIKKELLAKEKVPGVEFTMGGTHKELPTPPPPRIPPTRVQKKCDAKS